MTPARVEVKLLFLLERFQLWRNEEDFCVTDILREEDWKLIAKNKNKNTKNRKVEVSKAKVNQILNVIYSRLITLIQDLYS